MLDELLIEEIANQVLAQLGHIKNPTTTTESPALKEDFPVDRSMTDIRPKEDNSIDYSMTDLTSKEQKAIPLLENPEDMEALVRMMSKTAARIGVGRVGPRNKTKTMLTLRADHAIARDAVFTDVDESLPQRLGMFSVQTRCKDKNEHITRPDLGRSLDAATVEIIKSKCARDQDVQIIVSDGISSKAIQANLENILPVLNEGLTARGVSLGQPFFVRFGRVAVEDQIAEILGAKVVCILIGERPGLATAESMSAYICYHAKVGQPEARRTVVSNIHSGGISAVEAGAYICELICKILEKKASGVDLQQ